MEDYLRSVTTGGDSEYKSNPADFMKLLEGNNKSTPEDFMKLLEGDPKGGPLEPGGTGPHTPRIINDDNLAMKKILEKFHSVSEQSISVMDKKEIKRLASKKTSTDREWKVIVNEAEQETFYNIINTKANKSYFQNVKTLEAVELIIEHLERKEPINSTKIFKVLDLDETFRRNRIDAIQFKNKWKRLVERKKYANADIYEARYQKSKNLAIDAKRQLKKMQ